MKNNTCLQHGEKALDSCIYLTVSVFASVCLNGCVCSCTNVLKCITMQCVMLDRHVTDCPVSTLRHNREQNRVFIKSVERLRLHSTQSVAYEAEEEKKEGPFGTTESKRDE